MSRLKEAHFFLGGLHILKSVEGTDNRPRYEVTLEVWHEQEPMRFLVLDERVVHGGWTDDYSLFQERISGLAKKYGAALEFIDADLYKDELDRSSLQGRRAKQAHTYQYLDSPETVGLFLLKRLYGQ